MKMTVTIQDFVDAFTKHGRDSSFTHEGFRVLFDYLEGLDPDMELDVIAIDCSYSEMSVDEIVEAWDVPVCKRETQGERCQRVHDWLTEQTEVCGVTPSGRIVFASEF